MQKKKIVTLVLLNALLFASFGITFIDHHCDMAQSTKVSLMQFNLPESQSAMSSSCCSKINTGTNNIFKTEIRKNCCEFNQNKFDLSPSSIFSTIQKTALESEYFKKSIDDVKNSETVKQLENYYETAQVMLIKPSFNILKFISKITSLSNKTKED